MTNPSRAAPSGVRTQQMKMSRNMIHLTGADTANPAPATAPTMEWLVEMGIFQAVAITTHAQPANAETKAI